MDRTGGDRRVRRATALLRSDEVFISVLTIGEIVRGIEKLPPGKRRAMFEEWHLDLIRAYANQFLDVDLEIASLWGRLSMNAMRQGQTIPVVDALIGASALRHGLIVVTRNTEHFRAMGVPVFNPWEEEQTTRADA